LRIAEKCNIPIPKTQYFISELDAISDRIIYPFITKGRNGLSFYKTIGNKALVANNDAEFRAQLKLIAEKYSIRQTFTQELIPFDGSNMTISFTAFVIEGEIRTHWIGEKLREHPIRFGTATFARSIKCPQLIEPSKRLLKELRYTGVCEIEYILDPRDMKYKLIEINPRTWLWVGLARSCGIDYAVMIYNHLNGISTSYPSEYRIGVNWINFLTDIPFSICALFKGKLKLGQFFSSFKGKTTNAFFSWRDFKPGVMFFILFFYIAFKRR
jgi:predicted ATP-grasp superfamily ATP-dependent carboligase